ncbi:MAG: hydroxymethylbilane synthase [Prolixibacteraceae bacterium]|nr:hydroxymethylbilane synthase [Prolixibacteraceae bacterium]
MNKKVIKIGTRGSKLALWQSEEVKKNLLKKFPDLSIEIIIIKTNGDKNTTQSLTAIGNNGFFTKEIESELLTGKIDLAVHSLKDLPAVLSEGLIINGILPRGEVRDVLISQNGKKLKDLTKNDKIATSSLRRQSQLLHYNNNFQIIDIRGNIDTRLRKLKEGYCDALILAGAGMNRLNYTNLITEYIDPQIIFPAVGQGAIAIETRENDSLINPFIRSINDNYSEKTTQAERCFLKEMNGNCRIPMACYIEEENNILRITGVVSGLKGKPYIKKSVSCPIEKASEEATNLAKIILENGGKEILDQIK